jgi:DNA-directed RNA polymerase specialized sigma24 family protein
METREVCALLVRCARQRDDEAWTELLRRYGPGLELRVRRTLRKCGRWADDGEVEEMLQEVYCRLLEQGGRRLLACRGRNEGEVASYLGRLAARVVLDHRRLARAAKRRPVGVPVPRPAPLSLVERLPAPGSSPEDRALASARVERLLGRFQAVEGGPRGRRDLGILVLAAVGGWTSREIAQFLADGPGPSGVDSLLHRLKQRLRRLCPEPAMG